MSDPRLCLERLEDWHVEKCHGQWLVHSSRKCPRDWQQLVELAEAILEADRAWKEKREAAK